MTKLRALIGIDARMRLLRPHHCPYCLTQELEPARFRWWQLPLLLILLRPFRCPHCFERVIRGLL